MIVVEIIGGLGNQLFQYAHALSLAKELNQEIWVDLSFFNRYHRQDVYRLDKYSCSVNIASINDVDRLKSGKSKTKLLDKIFRKFGFSTISNGKFYFDNKRLDRFKRKDLLKNKDLYISGYYADQKYFDNVKDEIRKKFSLLNELNDQNREILKLIQNSEAICLHVRRGDYVNNGYFANLSMDYYHRAMEYINQRVNSPKYFVFSDDLEWVKQNLYIKNSLYVDVNDSVTDYMELELMTRCKHNIIANSTFSWWGGWLNNNADKIVIAPKIWYGNNRAQKKYDKGFLVPSDWVKI